MKKPILLLLFLVTLCCKAESHTFRFYGENSVVHTFNFDGRKVKIVRNRQGGQQVVFERDVTMKKESPFRINFYDNSGRWVAFLDLRQTILGDFEILGGYADSNTALGTSGAKIVELQTAGSDRKANVAEYEKISNRHMTSQRDRINIDKTVRDAKVKLKQLETKTDPVDVSEYASAINDIERVANGQDVHAEAMYLMGMIYDHGIGDRSQDFKLAANWYEKAIEKGSAEAMEGLGMMYYDGRGVEKNLNKAIELIRRSAHEGYAPAQADLGTLYYNGEGVKKDLEVARTLFELASEEGEGYVKEYAEQMLRQL